MNTSSQQRRHYLVARRFQLRFALQILLLLLFTSVVMGWTVYYSVWKASEGELNRLLEKERIDQADALQFRQAIRTGVGQRVAFRLGLLVFIAFVFTVFATHRMAGPIRHMEKSLENRLRGEPPEPIRLRRNDEFQALARLINEVLMQPRDPRVRGDDMKRGDDRKRGDADT
jgi:hypothetical protein